MTIIILTITGGVILIWAGVLAILKWISPVESKHLLSYAGYVTVICGVLIGLVLHTFITQQESAFATTRARLDQELGRFQGQLGELTGKLMGQMAEKAELTQSEWEVRGNLQTERAEHAQAQKALDQVRGELKATVQTLGRRTGAYVDSLSRERATLSQVQRQLAETQKELDQTDDALSATQTERDRSLERVAAQQSDIKRLDRDLKNALRRAEETNRMIAGLQEQLKQESVLQEKSLYTLQAAVDSVYRKVLKRHRVPEPADRPESP